MEQLKLYKLMVAGLFSIVLIVSAHSYNQLNIRVQENVGLVGDLTKSVAILATIQGQDSKGH